MAVSTEILDTFRWYRAAVSVTPRNGRHRPMRATEALVQARHDVDKGSRRYGAPSPSCLSRDQEEPGRAHIDKPEAFGLRHVGDVTAESYGGRDCWNRRGEPGGWYTDPHGDVFKDGTGLCWGVVYKLSSRYGCVRFVAGYQMGGTDSGPCLDLSTIYQSIGRAYDWTSDGTQYDAAREAARRADDMARIAADEERAYQTAWQAGSIWRERGDDITEEQRAARAILRERRAIRGTSGYPAICGAIRETIARHVGRIAELRVTRARLKSGDYDTLIFYPDARLREAFNEGAGEAVL